MPTWPTTLFGMPVAPESAALVTLAALLLAYVAWRLVHAATERRRAGRLAAKTSDEPEVVSLLPDSRYIDCGDLKIHYVQAGSGSDVVLLHGIGASVYVWRFLFPLLQTRHRVTAIDLPGFGKSSKTLGANYGLDEQCARVLEALKLLELERPHLVGSSMGGAIALWLAKTAPEKFGKIAVLAPATDSSLVPIQAHRIADAAPLLKHALGRRTMKVLLGAVVTRKELITNDVTDAYLEPFLDQGDAVAAFWSAMALLADRRLPYELGTLSSETLILHGAKDRMVSRRSIDRLLTLLPRATFESHAEAGHHIMEDEPAWTAGRLERFFSKDTSSNET